VEIFDNEIDFFVVSSVNDTTDQWWAVTMTPLTRVVDPKHFDWIQIHPP
jgi:hypothetical protein